MSVRMSMSVHVCVHVRVRCVKGTKFAKSGEGGSSSQVFKCPSSWKMGVNSGFWVIRGASARFAALAAADGGTSEWDSQPTDGGRQTTEDRMVAL